MRNYRLFGVVTAVLFSTSFLHPLPNSHQHHHRHDVAAHTGRAGIRLASAPIRLPAGQLHGSGPSGAAPRFGLLNPARARFMEAVWTWVAYEETLTPPSPPPSVRTPPTTVPARPAAPVAPSTKAAAVHSSAVPPAPVTKATPVPATSAASGGVWAALRQCESGGNYSDNTGNGYYGAYQFSLATWHGIGYPGVPSNAPPAVQDRAAQQLQARSGWGQWPACSRRLGLL